MLPLISTGGIVVLAVVAVLIAVVVVLVGYFVLATFFPDTLESLKGTVSEEFEERKDDYL